MVKYYKVNHVGCCGLQDVLGWEIVITPGITYATEISTPLSTLSYVCIRVINIGFTYENAFNRYFN